MGENIRLPGLDPGKLDSRQKALYDKIISGFGHSKTPHKWIDEDGILLGPFNAMLYYPHLGEALYSLQLKIVQQDIVPRDIFELAVLTTVSRCKAAYGIYAHILLGLDCGLNDDIVSAISGNDIPSNLDEKQSAAYRLAFALCEGPLPDAIYKEAYMHFGEEGCGTLIYAIGLFRLIATLLNAFDEPVPL